MKGWKTNDMISVLSGSIFKPSGHILWVFTIGPSNKLPQPLTILSSLSYRIDAISSYFQIFHWMKSNTFEQANCHQNMNFHHLLFLMMQARSCHNHPENSMRFHLLIIMVWKGRKPEWRSQGYTVFLIPHHFL